MRTGSFLCLTSEGTRIQPLLTKECFMFHHTFIICEEFLTSIVFGMPGFQHFAEITGKVNSVEKISSSFKCVICKCDVYHKDVYISHPIISLH